MHPRGVPSSLRRERGAAAAEEKELVGRRDDALGGIEKPLVETADKAVLGAQQNDGASPAVAPT